MQDILNSIIQELRDIDISTSTSLDSIEANIERIITDIGYDMETAVNIDTELSRLKDVELKFDELHAYLSEHYPDVVI